MKFIPRVLTVVYQYRVKRHKKGFLEKLKNIKNQDLGFERVN